MSDIDDAVDKKFAEEKIERHEARIAELDDRIKNHLEELGRVNARIDELEKHRSEDAEKIRELHDAIAEHDRVIAELKELKKEEKREEYHEPEPEPEPEPETESDGVVAIVEEDPEEIEPDPVIEGDEEHGPRVNRGFFSW
jgi:chromosome segregation ATPase